MGGCKPAGVRSALLSSDPLPPTPDCPCFPQTIKTTRGFPGQGGERNKSGLNAQFAFAKGGWQGIGRIMQIPEWQSQDPVDRGRCM